MSESNDQPPLDGEWMSNAQYWQFGFFSCATVYGVIDYAAGKGGLISLAIAVVFFTIYATLYWQEIK